METRFILRGGMTRIANEQNDSFFRELNKSLQSGDTVLHIGFARRESNDRERVFERDKEAILAQATQNIVVTSASTAELENQIQSAGSIFITGGDPFGLIEDIRKYAPNFKNDVQGKVVAGSSVGAYLFAANYFSGFEKGIQDGLGILPISLLCHYGNPDFDATDETLALLKEHSNDTEVLALKECEWVVR